MHVIKAFISVVVAFISSLIVFVLSLLCTINLPIWINGPPEHPVMPMGETFLSGLLAIISGLIVLFLMLKKYAGLLGKTTTVEKK